MELERRAVEFRETRAGGEPDPSVARFGDGHRVSASEAAAASKTLDPAVAMNAVDAEVGGHPDIAAAVFVNVADGVVRQPVGGGEVRRRSAGDAIQTTRRSEPARAVAALLDRENPGRAAVTVLHPRAVAPAMQTVRRAHRQRAGAVFENRANVVVIESVAFAPGDEGTGAELFESRSEERRVGKESKNRRWKEY